MNANQSKIVEYLINNNNDDTFDINDCNEKGMTASWFCGLNGNISTMKCIVKHFGSLIDINKCDNDGDSPLHVACQENHFEFVSYLLSNQTLLKLNVNIQNKYKQSPLMTAVRNGNNETVNTICNHIKNNDDNHNIKILDIIDDSRYNAIDYAAGRGHTSVLAKFRCV